MVYWQLVQKYNFNNKNINKNCLKRYDAISGLIDKMDDHIITRFVGNCIRGCGAYGALQSRK